jgi:hypothetical protein
MSFNDPLSMERKVSARLRVLQIIWAALLMSIMLFALLSFLVLRPSESGNQLLFWVFAGVGLMLILISFQIRQKATAQAVAERDETKGAAALQSAYIVAWALCEAAGLFGVMTRAITSSPYFYLLFVLAALGMFLNFPRREHVAAVTFKNRF